MPTKKVDESHCEDCDMHCCAKGSNNYSGSSSSAVYGIGLFGAAYYFLPQAVGVSGVLMAILKILGWPALLVYQALLLLKL